MIIKFIPYFIDKYGDYFFIIKGEAYYDDILFKKGEFGFISSNTQYHIKGNADIILITIKKEER